MVLVILGVAVCGCTATRVAREQLASVTARNTALQVENERLRQELARRDETAANLQMDLVRKRVALARSVARDKRQAADEVASAVHAPSAGTRTETIAYLAEVTAEVESVSKKGGLSRRCLCLTEKKLIDSNRAVSDGRFDLAVRQATEALELVNAERRCDPEGAASEVRTEFVDAFTLKVTRRSNVRLHPGIRAGIVTTLAPQTRVTALGHQGRWINVQLADGRRGWIAYSLLAVPEGGR